MNTNADNSLLDKRTKGEWRYEIHRKGSLVTEIYSSLSQHRLFFTPSIQEENEANAAFIVHAVNSHDKLVEINKELLEALKDMLFLTDTSERNFTSLWLSKIRSAKETIDKATKL